MVALRYPDRLLEIDLYVTSSITGPIIEMMQKTCQELETIRMYHQALRSTSDMAEILGQHHTPEVVPKTPKVLHATKAGTAVLARRSRTELSDLLVL